MTSNWYNKSVQSSWLYSQYFLHLVLTHRVLSCELAVVALGQDAGQDGEDGDEVDGGDHGDGGDGDDMKYYLGMMLIFLSHLSRNCHTLAPSLLLLNTGNINVRMRSEKVTERLANVRWTMHGVQSMLWE